jgi:hypothetical protein
VIDEGRVDGGARLEFWQRLQQQMRKARLVFLPWYDPEEFAGLI